MNHINNNDNDDVNNINHDDNDYDVMKTSSLILHIGLILEYLHTRCIVALLSSSKTLLVFTGNHHDHHHYHYHLIIIIIARDPTIYS